MYNRAKVVMLLGGLTALLVFFGNIFGGANGMVLALVLAAVMNFGSYWFSDKVVLSMYRAREIGPNDDPELYSIVQDLARNSGLPMPRLYVIPQDAPNAFATGRNPEHAVVAVTRGLRSIMGRNELAGVLGHELAHIKNRDMLIGSIAATLGGAVMMLASMAKWAAVFGFGGDDEEGGGIIGLLLTAILAPIAAMLIQAAVSRAGEFKADRSGAHIAGRPEYLASALQKLGSYNREGRMQVNPATSHLFIVNPLSGGGMMSLFSTHPPLEDRIRRLRSMA